MYKGFDQYNLVDGYLTKFYLNACAVVIKIYSVDN